MINIRKTIKFPTARGKNGTLIMFQHALAKDLSVPFPIKRVLLIKDLDSEKLRGGHTHHKTNQLLFCVSGGCSVTLDNGRKKQTIFLKDPNEGLWLKPYVWHTMQDFGENTILLVLADTIYDEKDYIRSYEEFKKCIKK
jgi:hypothetical protein